MASKAFVTSSSPPPPPTFGVQGSANRRSPGLENFVKALAYHFCLIFTAAYTQRGDQLLAEPCREERKNSAVN